MKKLVIAALIIAIVALSAAALAEPTKVVVATSGVSNPFSYEKDGKLTGYDVEIIRAIFDGLDDYEVEFEIVEFEGIFAGLDNGRYQMGINNLSWNPSRAEKYDFSLPYIENANVFVVRADDEALTSIDGLAGYKAVTEVGNSGATLLENYNAENPDAQCEIFYTEENFVKQFEDIEAGIYDVRIISHISAETAIELYGFTNLKIVPFEDPTRDPRAYILFSKTDDPALVEAVNNRLIEMYNDGTMLAISQEQLGGDYTPSAELMVAK